MTVWMDRMNRDAQKPASKVVFKVLIKSDQFKPVIDILLYTYTEGENII